MKDMPITRNTARTRQAAKRAGIRISFTVNKYKAKDLEEQIESDIM